MYKNQKGFSAIEAILILVIVGLIGFTGWYVWNSKKKTENLYDNSTSLNIPKYTVVKTFADCKKLPGSKLQESYPEVCVTATGKKFTNPDQKPIPEGWKLFESKELGFRFAYPLTKVWINAVNNYVYHKTDTPNMIGEGYYMRWVPLTNDKYIFTPKKYEGQGSLLNYNTSTKKWYSESSPSFSGPPTEPIKTYTSGNHKFYKFAGHGALYCGTYYLIFETSHSKMVALQIPSACDDQIKKDPEFKEWNTPDTYYISQQEKDLTQIIPTFNFF